MCCNIAAYHRFVHILMATHNIIDILSISKDWIEKLFATVNDIKQKNFSSQTAKGRIAAAIFFENSTRTLNSFKVAAIRQGIDFLDIDHRTLSLSKGESLKDTFRTFENLGVDYFIIRHSQSGFCDLVANMTKCHVINAGDGSYQHPTQALTDVFTIREKFGKIEGLNIGICGDVLHSRVARSNIDLLTLFGANITLIGPYTLVPKHLKSDKIKISNIFSKDITDKLDVIMMLRLQNERMQNNFITSLEDYASKYMLTEEMLVSNQKLYFMHPGPVNWNIEIAGNLQENYHSLIDMQVKNGVYIRAAIFEQLFKQGEEK